MLRKRSSRAVTTKQGLMTDQTTSLISRNKSPNSSPSPISYFLGSPRLFNGLLSKNVCSDTDAMSPTSILDLKNSPSFVNPFGYDRSLSKPPTPFPETSNSNSKPVAIGLALIDSIVDGKKDGSINRAALFGSSKLKVQIPETNLEMLPPSPGDFGIKTRSSQVLSLTSPVAVSGKEEMLKRQLSLKEMEMSEDYTCVIIHGPNPKTTHIFDDCIVECCCGDDSEFSATNNNNNNSSSRNDGGSLPDFLSFCYTCRDVLGQDKDIYMYRGEKAFCSHECRCQEMYLERMGNLNNSDDHTC